VVNIKCLTRTRDDPERSKWAFSNARLNVISGEHRFLSLRHPDLPNLTKMARAPARKLALDPGFQITSHGFRPWVVVA
jgi:hypothetical protein